MKLIQTGLICIAVVFLASFEAKSADESDKQYQVAKMLLQRARNDYEMISKAKAANSGLIEKIEQHLQPYLDRRNGELIYNFRKSASGTSTPSLKEIHELVDWHEKAIRRHLYYTEESINTGVKLNDALNRMDEFTPEKEEVEPDHELEEE